MYTMKVLRVVPLIHKRLVIFDAVLFSLFLRMNTYEFNTLAKTKNIIIQLCTFYCQCLLPQTDIIYYTPEINTPQIQNCVQYLDENPTICSKVEVYIQCF